jgi:hypothetical protein
MTNEDKKLVTDYMDWSKDYGYVEEYDSFRELDLNDAGLCVQEMQKRGEFRKFTDWTVYQTNQHLPGMKKGDTYYYDANFIAWLFNADNFFTAFVEWRKTK